MGKGEKEFRMGKHTHTEEFIWYNLRRGGKWEAHREMEFCSIYIVLGS